MDHPTIIRAFNDANAFINGHAYVYLSFKRENMFYKDSYFIVKGTHEEVKQAIERMYKDVEDEKRDFPRADHIDMLDTPFDNDSLHWTHTIHNSEEELEEYIKNIKPGYYPRFTVEYI